MGLKTFILNALLILLVNVDTTAQAFLANVPSNTPYFAPKTCTTNDGGYAIVSQYNFGVLFFKTDAWGKVEFQKYYSKPSTQIVPRDIVQMSDSGFSIACYYGIYSQIIRTDKHGDTLWTKIYKAYNGYKLKIDALSALSNNYIVAYGATEDTFGSDCAFIIKLYATGDTIFTRSFREFNAAGTDVVPCTGIKTNDGGYLLQGCYMRNFFKVDSMGNLLWNKLSPHTCSPAGSDLSCGSLSISNSNLIYFGSFDYSANELLVEKRDMNGNLISTGVYQNVFGGNNTKPRSIKLTCTYDGGFAIISNTQGASFGQWRMPFLLKCGANGAIQFSKVLIDSTGITGDSYWYPGDIKETLDSGLICTFMSKTTGASIRKLGKNYFDGCQLLTNYMQISGDSVFGSPGTWVSQYLPYTVYHDSLNVSNSSMALTEICSNIGSESNVWPGDCNLDFEANNLDFLYLNIALNDTGAARANASINWTAQPAANWSNFYNNGANHKHADSDGNGVVDLNDTTAIGQNYSLTHPYKLIPQVCQSGLPTFKFIANIDTANAGDTISISVVVDSNSTPVDSLLGIAYTILFNSGVVDTSFIEFNYDSSALGVSQVEIESLQKNFFDNGKVDLAVCRTDHNNHVSFSGLIGTIKFKINSNLPLISELVLSPTSVKGISQSGTIKNFNLVGDTIYIRDCNQLAQMILSDSVLCFGDTLFCSSISNYLSQYEWLIDSNFYSTNSSIALNYLTGGNHIISLTISNAYCNYNFSGVALIDKPLQPLLTLSGNILSSSINTNCQWFLNSQPIPFATEDTLVITQTGYYKVSITDSIGCIAISDSIYLNISGLEIFDESSIELFPTVLNNQQPLSISFNVAPKGKTEIWLLDNLGSSVLRRSYTSVLGTIQIPLPPLKTGNYFCIIKNNKIRIVKTIIIAE